MILLRDAVLCAALLLLCQCSPGSQSHKSPDSTTLHYYQKAQEAAKENNLNQMLHDYYLFLRLAQDQPETYASQLITSYIDIGNLFVTHSDFTSAKAYYDKGFTLSQTHGNADEQLQLMLGLCQTSLYTGDTVAARQWNNQILNLTAAPKAKRQHLYYLNHASDLMLQQRLDSAEWYYLTDLQLIEAHDIGIEEKFNSLLSLSKCYSAQNEIDSALHYAQQALNNADYSNIPAMRKLIAMRTMARLYARKGDIEQTAHYQTLCYDLRDSVENLRNFLAIKSEQEQFEEAQSQASIMRLATSNSRLQNMLLLGTGLVLLLLAFAYYVLRQKRKTDMNNRALFERNKELLHIEQDYKQLLQLSAHHDCDHDAANPLESAQPSVTHELDQALWQRILAVMDTLDELCKPDFGLLRLTALVESNTTYVSQTIKTATGKNVPTFINEYRVREACRRLLDTAHYGNLTLQALAQGVGFTSQSTFNRAFKQSTGLTPVVYRRLSNQQSDSGKVAPPTQ